MAPDAPPPAPKQLSWPAFAKQASDVAIRQRFVDEANAVLSNSAAVANAVVLAIFRPEDSLSSVDLDQIYSALMNTGKDYTDVVLLLLSRGGEIEPAYQISKICKTFATNGKFLVVVPRQAKSAATLIALGADEIHIGPLGQLGPIDPQIGGLPALGVAQALQTIASMTERCPNSAGQE